MPLTPSRLTNRHIFSQAATCLQALMECGPGQPLYGAKLVAANAWVNSAQERLAILMEKHSQNASS